MFSKKAVLKNTFAQILGKIATVCASLIVFKIVASQGTAFSGSYIVSYEFLAFFGIIADAGLFSVAVREMSANPKSANKIFGNILGMRLGLIFIVTLIAGISAQFMPNFPPEVRLGVWITGISMALTIIAGTLSAALQAKMKIKYFSLSLVAGKVFLATMIVSIWWFQLFEKQNLFWAFLWAGVVSNLVFLGLVFHFVRKHIDIQLLFDFSYWKKTITKNLPYGLALVLQTLYLRADIIIITTILGQSAAGIYGAQARILETFLVLGVFFGQAVLPKISAENNPLQTIFWACKLTLLISIPIIIGTYLLGEWAILFLTSIEFIEAVPILHITVWSVLMAYLNQILSYGLVTKKKNYTLLFINTIGFTANIALNLYLIPKHGIIAAAWSTVICELLVLTGMAYFTWKYLKND